MTAADDGLTRERAARDLQHSFVVDAGAGTGKTTVLISRILGAVISGKSDLEHIVAITFTEKAAGELKVRLRFELEQVVRRLDGEEERRARRAFADIERAQVATIHSFCAALLRERPVEAGVDPDFEVLDELGAHLLMDRTWDEWLAGEMDRSVKILLECLRTGVRPEEMRDLAGFLLDHRDMTGLVPHTVTEDLDVFMERCRSKLDRLAGLGPYCRDQADRAFAQVASLREDLDKLCALDPEEQRNYLLSHFDIHPTAGNQKNWEQKEQLEEVRRLLQEIQSEKESVASHLRHNRAVELIEWLRGYMQRYEEAKQESRSLDFFDLLYRCRELLSSHKQVRGYFQSRFDYILVDEFQDTDPLQIEILFFLAEKVPRAERWREAELRPGKLFLVGDPKQSIYSFRRADIEAYHEAKQLLSRQGEALPLAVNFRSRPPVVNWVNVVFSRLIQPLEDGNYQPLYQPIQPSRKDGEGTSLVVLPLAPQIPVGDGKARELRLAEARTVAAFLKRIVADGWPVWDPRSGEKRDLGYGDVGILFRTREAMDLYEEEFRDFDIPYRVAGGRRYYSRLEMNALLALLTCLDNPKDGVALVAALRSPFFGVSDQELFLHVQAGYPLDYFSFDEELQSPAHRRVTAPKSIREAFRFLKELHALRNDLSLSLFLLKIYETTRVLPLFYLKPQGDQKVANLLKMVEMARSLEERGLSTLRSFVQFLKKMDATEAEEGESPLAEETEDAVRIMTIHKAKGLEFPLVILADAAYERRARVRNGVMNRHEGRLEVRIGSQGSRAATQGWESAGDRERLREKAEDYRLLYVAMTRARDYFVIPFIPGDQKKRFLQPLWEGLELAEEVSWGMEVRRRSGNSFMVFDSRELDTEKRELRPFRTGFDIKKIGKKTKSKGKISEPSLAEYKSWKQKRSECLTTGRQSGKILPATSLVKGENGDGSVHGLGPAFGSFVHEILRAIDLHRPRDIETVAQALGKRDGFDEPTIERGIDLVRWGLTSEVLTRAARSSSIWKEVPFVYRHRDDLVEGFIDLAFEENAEIVVVDFKTDRVERGKKLEERVRRYTPQAVIYAMALERITHKKVKDVVLLFLSAKLEESIPIGKTAFRRVERLLRETS